MKKLQKLLYDWVGNHVADHYYFWYSISGEQSLVQWISFPAFSFPLWLKIPGACCLFLSQIALAIYSYLESKDAFERWKQWMTRLDVPLRCLIALYALIILCSFTVPQTFRQIG